MSSWTFATRPRATFSAAFASWRSAISEIHSKGIKYDQGIKSPNWAPYISYSTSLENLMMHEPNI